MRDTPILTQRRKNCILVKTNLEKSFILGLLFVFQLTVSLLYLSIYFYLYFTSIYAILILLNIFLNFHWQYFAIIFYQINLFISTNHLQIFGLALQ